MAVDCLLDRIATDVEMVDGTLRLLCGWCREPLLPWQVIQFDHVHAVVHGGDHSYLNLRPIHYDPCHKEKSARDVAANAKVKRIAAGGRKRKGPKMKSRPFQTKRATNGKEEKDKS